MTPLLENLKLEAYLGPVVYIVHLHAPLKHARHYVGSTCNLTNRMKCYRAGNSDASAFMRAVHRAGIDWHVSRIWAFDAEQQARDWEYSFKKGANGRQSRKSRAYCVVCRKEYLSRAAERMRIKRAKAI